MSKKTQQHLDQRYLGFWIPNATHDKFLKWKEAEDRSGSWLLSKLVTDKVDALYPGPEKVKP